MKERNIRVCNEIFKSSIKDKYLYDPVRKFKYHGSIENNKQEILVKLLYLEIFRI